MHAYELLVCACVIAHVCVYNLFMLAASTFLLTLSHSSSSYYACAEVQHTGTAMRIGASTQFLMHGCVLEHSREYGVHVTRLMSKDPYSMSRYYENIYLYDLAN